VSGCAFRESVAPQKIVDVRNPLGHAAGKCKVAIGIAQCGKLNELPVQR